MTSEKSNRIILPLMIVTVMFAGAFALNQSEDVDAGYVYGEDYLLDPVVNGSYGYTNDGVGVESVHRIINPSSGSVLEIEIMGISGGSSYSLYYTITEISGTWRMYTPYASDRYTSDDVGNGFMIGMGMYNYIRFGSSSENVMFNIVESQAYTTTATVHYDANGGTDAPEPTVKTINSLESIEGTTTVRLSNSEPTLSDLEFLGWSESPTATTATYQPNDTITIGKTDDLTLYAVWPTPSPGSTITVTTAEALIKYAAYPNLTVIVGYTGNDPNMMNLPSDLVITDGTVVRMPDAESNGAGINPNGYSIIKEGSGESRLKIFADDETLSLYQLYLDGQYIITDDGSDIILDVSDLVGDNSVITRSGTLRLTGNLDANIGFETGGVFLNNPEPVIVFEDIVVGGGSEITLVTSTSSVNISYEVDGSMDLYGTIRKSDSRGAILLETTGGSTVQTYDGSIIDTVAVRPMDGASQASIDLSKADVDLGVYIGGENYSNRHETYSGIDGELQISTESNYYLSYGANINLTNNSGFWGGFSSIGVNDLGLSLSDDGLSGTVSGYGTTEATYEIEPGPFKIHLYCYLPTSTVSFYSNGVVVATQVVENGNCAVPPEEPTLYGYDFRGWFLDDGTFLHEFVFTAQISSDISLYAKWEGILQYTTDPVSDGTVTAVDGQPGTVMFRATDSLYYSSVLWDFGDGTTSTNTYATHYYGQPGTYTATLTVFNNSGSDTTEYIIEVPEMAAGGGGKEILIKLAAGIEALVKGGLVVRMLR